MKKALIFIIVAAFLGAGTLAASDWVGTFSGDHSGSWEGTLTPTQDPPFTGEWETSVDPPDTGFLRGNEIEQIGNYYYLEGDVLDDNHQDIGDWSGRFPIPDAQASGIWRLDNGDSGTFTGYQP